jgi:hypothetical protein
MTGPRGQHTGEEKATIRRAKGPAPSTERALPAHPLLRLQRQVGNQAVAGMLAQRQDEDELQMKRDATLQRQDEDELQMRRDPALQRQEEDELQASRDPALQRHGEELQASRDPALQRQDEDELQASRDPALQRQEEDEEALQAKPAPIGLEGGPVSAATAGRIDAARGGGRPLDASSRSTMESAFATSFADVRVHTGPEASALNREVGALAFTTGNDVFMRDDTASPDSEDGQRLLGHELSHVVQQRSMPSTGEGMRVGPAGDHYEQAADVKAAEIVSRLAASGHESEAAGE